MSESIEAGQVWEHHSTGSYRVIGFTHDGHVRICREDSMQPREVWPEYFRRNFTLLRDEGRAEPGAERDDVNATQSTSGGSHD